MSEQNDWNPKAQEMYNSIHAIVKLSRWFYECSLKEGFTPKKAMEIADSYIIAVIGGRK